MKWNMNMAFKQLWKGNNVMGTDAQNNNNKGKTYNLTDVKRLSGNG